MPFAILKWKGGRGWALAENGDVVVKDLETQQSLRVPYSEIGFTEENVPYIIGSTEVLQIEDAVECNDEDFNSSQLPETRNPGPISKYERNISRQWQFNDTLALISAVEEKYEDMHHPKKKKHFWDIVCEELISLNINVDAMRCKKKWDNLVMTYKKTKDIKTKTGKAAPRFQFFERLDELLGEKPNNCSPHTIDVGNASHIEPFQKHITSLNNAQLENSPISPPPTTTTLTTSRKRVAPVTQYLSLKEKHYNESEKAKQEYRNKKLKLFEQKLALEERKVVALENLSKRLK